jgi:MYXO-CTERM domain-containing protein
VRPAGIGVDGGVATSDGGVAADAGAGGAPGAGGTAGTGGAGGGGATGAGGDAGSGPGPDPNDPGEPASMAGCSCELGGVRDTRSGTAWLLLALAIAAMHRRRR